MRASQYGFGLLELMLAISLGALLLISLLHIFSSMHILYQRQMIFSDIQERERFISLFLREKIHMAGNWSCQKKKPGARTIMIRVYDSDDAKEKLGLTIKSGSDLLQLHECIRLHDHAHFLPVNFFVANTYRINSLHKMIYALFIKINHHPREELISGMSQWNVQLFHQPRYKKNIIAVRLDYVLSAISKPNWDQPGVLFVAKN